MEQTNQVLRVYAFGEKRVVYVVGPATRSDMEQRTAALLYIAQDKQGKLYAATNGRGLYENMDIGANLEHEPSGMTHLVNDVLDYVVTEHFMLLSDPINTETFKVNYEPEGKVLTPGGRRVPMRVDESRREWENFCMLNGTPYASQYIAIQRELDKERALGACNHSPRPHEVNWPSADDIKDMNPVARNYWDTLINGLKGRADFNWLKATRKVIGISRIGESFYYAIFIPGTLKDDLRFDFYVAFTDSGDAYVGDNLNGLCTRMKEHRTGWFEDIGPWLAGIPVNDFLSVRRRARYPEHQSVLGRSTPVVIAKDKPVLSKDEVCFINVVMVSELEREITSYIKEHEFVIKSTASCEAPNLALFPDKRGAFKKAMHEAAYVI